MPTNKPMPGKPKPANKPMPAKTVYPGKTIKPSKTDSGFSVRPKAVKSFLKKYGQV
jgi:hypothetical protein